MKSRIKRKWLYLIVPIVVVWIAYAISCSGVKVVIEIPEIFKASVLDEYVTILTANATPSDHMSQDKPFPMGEEEAFVFQIKKANGIQFIVTFEEDHQPPDEESDTHFAYSIDLTDIAPGTYAIVIRAARQTPSQTAPRNDHEAQIWIQVPETPSPPGPTIAFYGDFPLTTTQEEIPVTIISDQFLDSIHLYLNEMQIIYPDLEPSGWDDDDPLYVVSVEAIPPGTSSLEITGSNENGTSNTIETNVERHGISLESKTVSDCDDDGECLVSLFFLANYRTIEIMVHVGEVLVVDGRTSTADDWEEVDGDLFYRHRVQFPVSEGSHSVTISVTYSKDGLEDVTDTLPVTIDCECTVPTLPPEISFHEEIPRTTDKETIDVTIRSDQLLDSIHLYLNEMQIHDPVFYPPEEDGDMLYVVSVEALAHGTNHLEITGSNENGTSNTIETNVERHGISLKGEPVFDCIDGKCVVKLEFYANYYNIIMGVYFGQDRVLFERPIGEESDNGRYKFFVGLPVPDGADTITVSVTYEWFLFEEEVTDTLTVTIDCDCTVPTSPPEISFHEEIPRTTDQETIDVTIRSDQLLDSIQVDVNDTSTIYSDREPWGWEDDEPLYVVSVEAIPPGTSNLEIAGSNDNGTSNTIETTVARHGISLKGEPVSECDDDGECRVNLFFIANYAIINVFVAVGEDQEIDKGPRLPHPGSPTGGPYTYSVGFSVSGGNHTVTLSVTYPIDELEGVTNTLTVTIDCDCTVPTGPVYEYHETIGESELQRITDMTRRDDGTIAILETSQSGQQTLHKVDYSENPVPTVLYSIPGWVPQIIGIADMGFIRGPNLRATVLQTVSYGIVFGEDGEPLTMTASYDPTGKPLAVTTDPDTGRVCILTENPNTGQRQIESRYPIHTTPEDDDLDVDPNVVGFRRIRMPDHPWNDHFVNILDNGKMQIMNEDGEVVDEVQLPLEHGTPQYVSCFNETPDEVNFPPPLFVVTAGNGFIFAYKDSGSWKTEFHQPSWRSPTSRSEEPVITRIAVDTAGRIYISRSDLPGIEVWLPVGD